MIDNLFEKNKNNFQKIKYFLVLIDIMAELDLKLTLKKLLRCSNLSRIAQLMVTKEGFDANVDELEKIIDLNLRNGERLSLIYSDGRLFFDSYYPRTLHNGIDVFQSEALKNASINGSKTELSQLAIENHMTRPEVLAASQHPSFVASAKRISSTTSPGGLNLTTYVAQAVESPPGTLVVIRLSLSSLIEDDVAPLVPKMEKLDLESPSKKKASPVPKLPRTRLQK